MKFFVAIFLCGLSLVSFGQDSISKRKLSFNLSGGPRCIYYNSEYVTSKQPVNINYLAQVNWELSEKFHLGMLAGYCNSKFLFDSTIFIGNATGSYASCRKIYTLCPIIKYDLFTSKKIDVSFGFSPIVYNRMGYAFCRMLNFNAQFKLSKRISLFSAIGLITSQYKEFYFEKGKYKPFGNWIQSLPNYDLINFNVGLSINTSYKSKHKIFKKFNPEKLNRNSLSLNFMGLNYERVLVSKNKFEFSQSISYVPFIISWNADRFTTVSTISFGNKRLRPEFGIVNSFFIDELFSKVYDMDFAYQIAPSVGVKLFLSRCLFIKYNAILVEKNLYDSYNRFHPTLNPKELTLLHQFASLGFSF